MKVMWDPSKTVPSLIEILTSRHSSLVHLNTRPSFTFVCMLTKRKGRRQHGHWRSDGSMSLLHIHRRVRWYDFVTLNISMSSLNLVSI
jgi:hypothetical protein